MNVCQNVVLTAERVTTILDKSLGTLAHVFSICRGNLSVRPPLSDSMLFIVMNLSLLASNIVGGRGGGGGSQIQ